MPPMVFLPGNVVTPAPAPGQLVKSLSYQQLVGLRDEVAESLNSRTPDPQARRYEFKHRLLVGLERLRKHQNINDIEELVQFKAMVEGVLYGHLRLKIFDLRDCNFSVPEHWRYLGTLIDNRGDVFGGTDPEMLFFGAADQPSFDNLNRLNSGTRPTAAGTRARALLAEFKNSLANIWAPDQILWMELLDRLFFGNVNVGGSYSDLAQDWKQVGPIHLRLSTGNNSPNYGYLYFPVFEAGYRQRAIIALSGTVTKTDDELHLGIDSYPAAKVLNPLPGAAANQDPVWLGAGSIELITPPPPAPASVEINYEELAPYIHNLLNVLNSQPQAAHFDPIKTPFRFPDLVRIPAQHDGFVFSQWVNGAPMGEFSRGFISIMRGRGVHIRPMIDAGLTPPCLVNQGGNLYFVDSQGGARAFYFETYQNILCEELSRLGYVLWLIYSKAATVDSQGRVINQQGQTLMHYTGSRYELDPSLRCEWPQRVKRVADLQRFWGAASLNPATDLFRVAASEWLKRASWSSIPAQSSNPQPITIGPHRWFTD